MRWKTSWAQGRSPPAAGRHPRLTGPCNFGYTKSAAHAPPHAQHLRNRPVDGHPQRVIIVRAILSRPSACGRQLGGGLSRCARLALPAFGGKWRAWVGGGSRSDTSVAPARSLGARTCLPATLRGVGATSAGTARRLRCGAGRASGRLLGVRVTASNKGRAARRRRELSPPAARRAGCIGTRGSHLNLAHATRPPGVRTATRARGGSSAAAASPGFCNVVMGPQVGPDPTSPPAPRAGVRHCASVNLDQGVSDGSSGADRLNTASATAAEALIRASSARSRTATWDSLSSPTRSTSPMM
jgi:hypothetical protein